MSIKVGDMVRAFNGNGDVVEWLKKINLVIKLQKLGDASEVIPLFLEGQAFSVYEQMKEKDQADATKIEAKLVDTFSMNRFAAYSTFSKRVWEQGEPVEVYLSDLKRLAGLARINDDELIRCAFVVGLPTDVSCHLRSSSKINDLTIDDIADMAKVYLVEQASSNAMVAVRKPPSRNSPQSSQMQGSYNRASTISCHVCGGNHLARVCTQRKITCWTCGEQGHTSRDCQSKQDSGNGEGKQHAPAASQMRH